MPSNRTHPTSQRALLLEALSGHMHQCEESGKLMGLILVNVHRYRLINTTYGYAAGDRLSELIHERLGGILRPQDQLLCISQDEFALILPGIFGVEHVELAANRIQELLRTPFVVRDQHLKIRVGIGITLFPEHAPDPHTLLRRCDLALSRSMHSHSDYELHAPGANDAVYNILQLEEDLSNAIIGHELDLVFQPKVSLATGKAYGAEALSRWTHDKHGPISPDQFIGLAEQNGLIVPLTNWSLNTALRLCAACQVYFQCVSVAVNVSAKLLHDPDLVEMVRHAMALWNTPPENLILEITESAMMTDPRNSLRVLNALYDMGIRLSIDDFGTGYSSLAYMKHLPVYELKIDKSFILNMLENPKDTMIVQSVIDLAHNFDMQVLAEGVENEETLQRLHAMGCDAVQGYHISRPLPSSDMLEWMQRSPWGIDSCGSLPKR